MISAYLLTEEGCGTYDIEAGHEIALPGVICPNCGTWARTSADYPTITREVLLPVLTKLNGQPLPLPLFRELQNEVTALVGTSRPLFPGTKFGCSVGWVTGELPDFAWPNPWTLFAKRTVFDWLQERGLDLKGNIAQLKSDQEDNPLVELEAVPRVRLHESVLAQQQVHECELCGRVGVRKPDVIVLESTSFDGSLPLQRVYELTSIIVNDEFARAIRDMGLQGAKLSPVELR